MFQDHVPWDQNLTQEQYGWARELIRKLNYRRGWEIMMLPSGAFGEGDSTRLLLAAESVVEDVNTGYMAPLSARRVVPVHRLLGDGTREDFLVNLTREIFQMIRELEDHERMEWFRIQGVAVYDPHPGGGAGVSMPDFSKPNLSGLDRPAPGPGMGYRGGRGFSADRVAVDEVASFTADFREFNAANLLAAFGLPAPDPDHIPGRGGY